MIFVITGATSFLGTELCNYIIAQKNEVYAVCRRGSVKASQIQQSSLLHIIYSDMSEYFHLDELIGKADIFINLAWNGTGHSGRDNSEIQEENKENCYQAMKAAHKMGCSLFVETGSQAEYGTVLEKINEDTPCHPFSEYGMAKLAVKELGYAFAEKTGMKYMHLRIFSLFGEHDHSWTLIMSSLSKMKNNASIDLSTCEQNWNFLHVEDAAKQVYKLCIYAQSHSDFKHEIYNIASEDTRKLKDFVNQIKYLTKSKSDLNYGAIKPANIVSLNPDVSKTRNTINFIADHQFEDDIINIYNSIH